MDPKPDASRLRDQLHLVGVESQLVQAAQPLGDPVPLVGRAEELVVIEFRSQPGVPALEFLADHDRIDVRGQQVPGLQVHQLAAYPLAGQLEVETTLPSVREGCFSLVSVSTR